MNTRLFCLIDDILKWHNPQSKLKTCHISDLTRRKYWLITQEVVAPSRHDWKIVDWDVKPQHKQTFQINALKVIACSTLLSLYAMPVLIMGYSTRYPGMGVVIYESGIYLPPRVWKWGAKFIHCHPHMLSKWRWRSQWWRFGKECQQNTTKLIPVHHTHIDSALKFGQKLATEYQKPSKLQFPPLKVSSVCIVDVRKSRFVRKLVRKSQRQNLMEGLS